MHIGTDGVLINACQRNADTQWQMLLIFIVCY